MGEVPQGLDIFWREVIEVRLLLPEESGRFIVCDLLRAVYEDFDRIQNILFRGEKGILEIRQIVQQVSVVTVSELGDLLLGVSERVQERVAVGLEQ